MISVDLPYPPSANRLWRAVRGRQIKSAEYRAWLLEAQAAITAARVTGSMPGAYHLEIHATRPDWRARDLDNLVKPLSDAIAAAGLVINDSKAVSILAAWSPEPPVKGGAITVNLRSA